MSYHNQEMREERVKDLCSGFTCCLGLGSHSPLQLDRQANVFATYSNYNRHRITIAGKQLFPYAENNYYTIRHHSPRELIRYEHVRDRGTQRLSVLIYTTPGVFRASCNVPAFPFESEKQLIEKEKLVI